MMGEQRYVPQGFAVLDQKEGVLLTPSEIAALLNAFPALVEASKRVLAEPYGCRFCDSGKLRNPTKGHDDDCGFLMLRGALQKAGGQ